MQPHAAPAVAELVRALALGWKNLAAYPRGHPALAGSVEQAHRRLIELRGPAGEVVFGIASDGLVYGQEKIDWPQAQKLAHALYTRGVAVVRFASETQPADLETFLRLLGSAPTDRSVPIWDELTAAGVMSINLQPVDYSSVQVTDDLTPREEKSDSASLWEEILKALLAGKDITADARQLLTSVRSVDDLAALIMRHVDDAGAEAQFDPDATFGVRMMARVPRDTPAAATTRVAEAIGAHVAGSRGLRRQLALQQVAQLLRSLPGPLREAIIRSVLATLASDEAAAAPLREFASELDRDEVLEALRYLSSMVNLSSHATRLLQTLAATAAGPTAAVQKASPALISELVQLFGEEDIDRFNPPEHSSLLEDVAVEIPQPSAVAQSSIEALGDRVDTVADDVVNLQVARSLLELIARHGGTRPAAAQLRRVEGAFQTEVGSGQFAEALEIVQRLREIAGESESDALREAVKASLGRLASSETMDTLVAGFLAAPPESSTALQWLIDALGEAALQSLLLALAEEGNRSRRRKLFDFVAALGPKIVPEVTRFLSDRRWYVVRNMIVLLRSVNDRSSLSEIRRLAGHADLRVRLEAIKSLLVLDPTMPHSLLENVIHDPDPKLAEMAIGLVGSYGIREAVEPLLQVIETWDLFGARRAVRIRALKALGEIAEPGTLGRIERFFTDSIFPWPARAERRAAWESLEMYPPEARDRFVEKGMRSRDPLVREICRKLAARR
ncbi:MAG TPA: hypothetical protein VNA04_03485 [Thermoanaerobaculia bacterium]|nr:hypothetical protein [Thermoanaerobaculia bacterium]